jgi:autotransporter-associated beta strand protein
VAQQRALGLDVSYYQGNLSTTTWATFHRPTDQQVNGVYGDGRDFVFIRASRGGTTGTYDPSNTANDTLARRYDDPYFVQNITRATAAGMFAGSYHFGRPDVISSTANANGIPNNGTDEANHFIQMAGPWMRPGYLLPVFDFEAGSAQRSPSELAQFAIDFSNRIYAVKNIRPAVYIGNNYASPMDAIPESATIAAAYPTLWSARWPTNPNIQSGDPGDYTSTVYGPWDNPPNSADPWHFWQYTSTGGLNGYSGNLDKDVAHGGTEYLKDHLVPALWMNDNSGDWTTLSNWNSGETPVAPVQGPGQMPRVGPMVLPTPRLPGEDDAVTGVLGQNDTVVLDRGAANPTITFASGAYNIRKLVVREALNITGGSLTTNYVPLDPATFPSNFAPLDPFSAQFSQAVTLSGAGSLSVNTLQVDSTRTFTLSGGSLTFKTINLMPASSNPATIAMTGDATFAPLANVAAAISNGTGTGQSGFIDLGNATRSFNVLDGASDADVNINVPITNGALTKIGPGTLALNGNNTYVGDTRIQAGILRMGLPKLADAADVYITTGATLNLNWTGNPDTVHGLYFDGVSQTPGIWGPVGSGAQFTSALLTGTGKLNVTPVLPPPGTILDSFEVDEGHFSWPYNYSPVSQTFGLSASTAIDRVTTQHQGTGVGSQQLNLVIDSTGDATWQIRHNSGIGAGLAAQPGGNVPLEATGYVGFWLKTDDPGISVRIAIDDPVDGNTALERGFAQALIADNEWHLYQWNFEDANHWDAFAGGANGVIDAQNGTVTIDSIWFNGSGNAQIYLDNVSHNPDGLLSASIVIGDYNGDGVVDSTDYAVWSSTFGDAVTTGAKADGNRSGLVDAGDFAMWRKMTPGAGGGAGAAAAIPEPASALFASFGIVALLVFSRRNSLAS